MSDNEDLLGDDLGDHSLADYNLGNEEEEQLLADDYDSGPSQNVPSSLDSSYTEAADTVPTGQNLDYTQQSGSCHYRDFCFAINLTLVTNLICFLCLSQQPVSYTQPESECIVPNIIVEVPNMTQTDSTYPQFTGTTELERTVPSAIPATPAESPQIVPSEMPAVSRTNAQRSPRARNIPDSLDKVLVPRGAFPRGRTSWRSPHYRAPYRRHRGNFNQRPSFPAPQIRQQLPNPQPIRPDIPEIRPDLPQMGPEISPERPILPQEMIPVENRQFNQNFQRYQYRNEERPNFNTNVRPNFDRPMYYPHSYNPNQFTQKEIIPNMPQVIRQPLPVLPVNLPKGREPEVRMLPVLPPNLPNLPNLPPGGLAGKKVLINPHFKGSFQPPVEGFTYIPTRIQKSPPHSPTLESKFGTIKDIDDAAERFIAEQRNALARAASRKLPRRSPQRYIENTTIEIENELARSSDDMELLRRQEEFINANRAGLRRRMRSPSPPRSPSPRRSPERRPRPPDEESEYRRRVREQETLRERVLRAKEVRRRKNAVALQKHLADREKDRQDKDLPREGVKQTDIPTKPTHQTDIQQEKPDTTRTTPEKEKEIQKAKIEKEGEKIEKGKIEKEKRDRSPIRVESAEANSTSEPLTPPPASPPPASPPRDLTPPLPPPRTTTTTTTTTTTADSDDDLDIILDDIDDILSDEDSGRFKEKRIKEEQPKLTKIEKQVDLRSKLPPKTVEAKKPRQKIIFNDNDDKKKREKSPVRRNVLESKKNNSEKVESKAEKSKIKVELSTTKSRQKIIFDNKDSSRGARRVVLRPEPSAGAIFSRAVRTLAPAPGPAPAAPGPAPAALVRNLPPGITDTRLRTLAADAQVTGARPAWGPRGARVGPAGAAPWGDTACGAAALSGLGQRRLFIY
ncbi:actin cytoskeleton-regulatory complex protein pan1-like [Melitaea cinxia]|uniref:actin cytoskeleton-regulatory complex protein pan1-like n=1 Tax=Melitaea cinxia TaxID=113334 RepID=UPI001E2745FE|nr:actin cytoskeleton-regulatory complex protein pan1-like [Melitaea cinxia]